MWWECPGCYNEVKDDPHSHSDCGGVIVVYGPRCEECDEQMVPSSDQDEERT